MPHGSPASGLQAVAAPGGRFALAYAAYARSSDRREAALLDPRSSGGEVCEAASALFTARLLSQGYPGGFRWSALLLRPSVHGAELNLLCGGQIVSMPAKRVATT